MRGFRLTARSLVSGVLVGVLTLMMTGCATYYKVTDTATDHAYYTKKVKHKGSGAVEFIDAETEARVTLQSSEVRKVSKDTFKEGLAN